MDLKPQVKAQKNGLKLVLQNISQMQSVTSLLLVKAGSRQEKEEQAGMAHFLEHLVFKGTKKYPNALILSSAVDSIGAEFNAFTSKEYTGFYVKAAASHLALALDILAELVFAPLLPKEEIEKEKGVIIEEINMYEDNPMAKVALDFENLIFPHSSLGRETIGYKKTIKKFKRFHLLAFKDLYYQPQNMVLAIAGNLAHFPSSRAIACQIGKSFAEKKVKSLHKLEKLSLGKSRFMQQKPALKIAFKKTEQSHLCLGFRAFKQDHPYRYVLAVLSTILGGNMSSRLFTEIREKRGLAYYIKSSLNAYTDNGYLLIQAGVDHYKTKEAVKVILEVLSRADFSNKEIKRAKEFLKGRLALDLEDSREIASLFAEDLLMEGKIRTPAEIRKKIDKVSLGDLKKISRKIFVAKGLNFALVGPHKDEEKFAKILKI